MPAHVPDVSVAEKLVDRILRARARTPAGGDAPEVRGPGGRRDRPVPHGAQRGLRQERARGLRRRRPVHRDRPCPHAERGRRRLRQRHRGPWRGFRRHLRGRAGACRRRDRAGGARGLRAPPSGRRVGAARHRGRRRDDVPARPGDAQAGAQGRLPSDRGVRRHGGRRRRRGRARARSPADGRRARHRRQHGGRHHRISGRGRLDQAHACGLGGAVGPARGAAGAQRIQRPAHRVRGHARPLSRLRPHHRGRLRRAGRRFRRALGRPRRSPSSPIRAGR